MDPFLNQVLCQRYKIRARLSQKPGRRTFVATDLETDTTVIVKLLLFDMEFTWEHLRLFERESTALQSLEHPAIPKYLDFVDIETELGKGFLLVQTYIEAKSLQEWIMTGRTFSEDDLRHIARAVLDILDYLHNRKPVVIHRDIKPSNLLLTERTGNHPGHVYLVDFGGIQAPQHGNTITIVGTYGYMPLEQFGGRAAPASDLYSLGATLVYLATGQHPAHLPQQNMQLQFADRANLSADLTHWLQWLTAPDLTKRPQSVAVALDRFDSSSMSSATKSDILPQPLSRVSALSAREHPLREPVPTHSAIQLSHTHDNFTIQVPVKNFRFETLFPIAVSIWMNKQLGATGKDFLGLIVLILLISGFIWPVLILLAVIYLSQHSQNREKYSLTFSRSSKGALLSLTEVCDGHTRKIFQQPLMGMVAGPDKLPYYRLSFKSNGVFPTIRIMGNYHEIRWLCDELDTWSRMPITYRDASAKM